MSYYIIEMVTHKEKAFALLANQGSTSAQYLLFDILNNKILQSFYYFVPFHLKLDKNNYPIYDIVNQNNAIEFLKQKIINQKDCGLLELGMNNHDARIAWSQVYYLNSFIDIVGTKTQHYFTFLSDDFKRDILKRLKIEIRLINLLLAKGVVGLQSTRYSIQQQPRLYAVQTGRVLRLLKRYQRYFESLGHFDNFRKEVSDLTGHEEIFYISSEKDIDNLPKDRVSLKWPRGIDFPFDGFKIPFNQQDDWANGVSYGRDISKNKESRDIILTLLERSGITEATLDRFKWLYWYGRVSETWAAKDNLSKNTLHYYGDKGFADISYQTIDVSALLTVAQIFPELVSQEMLDKIKLATSKGLLYPFIQADLAEFYSLSLTLNSRARNYYCGCDSPWCIANIIWALKDIGNDSQQF